MGGSGVIPGWKVKRELSRLGQQLRAIPEAIWEPFARRAHDAAFQRGFPITEGALPFGPKVAIVLCWQPHGLAPSFLDMADHLVACGYAPFVVSNAPLSTADRQSLIPRTWRVMERPNFGYDFGGYRDGLFMLRRWGVNPDRLVILNDSIWFPLWPGDLTLQQAEASPFDVTGTILRHRDDVTFLESYFFSMRGAVLAHPAFRAFWDELQLTSNKYKVIRRGERGFGVALRGAGISMGPLFPTVAFTDALSRLDDKGLRQALRYMATANPLLADEGARLASATTSDWDRSARVFVARVLEKALAYSSFPVMSARELRYPVLKKSAEPISAQWRIAFLNAMDAGVVPQVLPRVAAEVRARATHKTA
jgi:hypothetical protein